VHILRGSFSKSTNIKGKVHHFYISGSFNGVVIDDPEGGD
jgi:hypothetical protein